MNKLMMGKKCFIFLAAMFTLVFGVGVFFLLTTVHIWWMPVVMFGKVLLVLSWSMLKILWRDIRAWCRALGPPHPGPIMRRPINHVDVTASAIQSFGASTTEH